LKLLAIQGLQHSDPEQAIPMLEKILQGPQSPRLKERALFVLAQSNSPRARQVLAGVAKGAGNPDLQRRAIQYLGVNGTRENRELLAEIYAATSDVDVKRRILRAFMVAGDRARVLAAATGEKMPELREEAVRQLGVMGAHEELWQLYQKESTLEVKKQILQAMFVGGNATRLIELANAEPIPELRRTAIRNLGLINSRQTADALVGLYAKEKDPEIRKAVIQGLFVQNNAEQLVAIARKETDPEMRKEIVRRLSTMNRSKVAMDYLMEILNK
jgi:HEAT repeat protein